LPWLGLGILWGTDRLGADPLTALIQEIGLWALNFLLLTLTITPLRLITGWRDLNKRLKLRHILGLFAFLYSSLHLLAYLWFEHSFDLTLFIKDLSTRPPLLLGMCAFLLMLPLTITSHSTIIKRLGTERWKHLHHLIYWIAIGSIGHFLWLAQSKADLQHPIIYAGILAFLLLLRFPPLLNRLTRKTPDQF